MRQGSTVGAEVGLDCVGVFVSPWSKYSSLFGVSLQAILSHEFIFIMFLVDISMTRSMTAAGERSGCIERTTATTPAAIGVAMLVPLLVS